ncbi:hypothetical protein H4R34_001894 [Dimargaris verticillata]|uniref:CLASP N-terminal domain-containing protein n=1 Tax=Dimargaris verticillata TaxID=2761393 RepID=A0A9W8B2S1_9FUNG|nr:hypothetical protein H4R34_001894 [Dimargaris verticillata]
MHAPFNQVSSVADLETHLPAIRKGLQAKEGEGTWRVIDDAISTLTALIRGGATAYPSFHSELATLATPFLTDALLTERTRLSGSAVELVVVFGQAVAKPLPVLIDVFVPSLLKLCSRTNKVFVTRAKRCMVGLIATCQMTEALSQYHEALKSTNKILRECAVEFVLATIQVASPGTLNATHLGTVELTIKDAIVDSAPKVRDTAKQCYKEYCQAYPVRLPAFHDTLSATARKYLGIGAAGTENSSKPAASRFTIALRRQKLAAIKAKQEAAAQTSDGATTDISALFSMPVIPLASNNAPQRITVVNDQPKLNFQPIPVVNLPPSNSAPASPVVSVKQPAATETGTTSSKQTSMVGSNPEDSIDQNPNLNTDVAAPHRPLKRRASSPLPKPLPDATVRLDKAPAGIFNVLKKAKAMAISNDSFPVAKYPPRTKGKPTTSRMTTAAAFPSYRRPTIASALRAQRTNHPQPSLFRTLSDTPALPANKKRRTYSQSSHSSVTVPPRPESPTRKLAQLSTMSIENGGSSHGEDQSPVDNFSTSLVIADNHSWLDKSAPSTTDAVNEPARVGRTKVSNIVASFETVAAAVAPRANTDRNPKPTTNKQSRHVLTAKSSSTTNSHRNGAGHFRSLTATRPTDTLTFTTKHPAKPRMDSQNKSKNRAAISADKTTNKACEKNDTNGRGGNISIKHTPAAVDADGKENHTAATMKPSSTTAFRRDRLTRKRQVALMRRRCRRRESQPYARMPVDGTVTRHV